MKPALPRTLICFLLLSIACGNLAAQGIAPQLTGKLVSLNGKRTQPVNDSNIAAKKYFAFYYGAGWCGPCRKFAPDLVSFYNEMKTKHPEFEIVFVSSDQSENEMEKYMAEMSMPWPAMRFSSIRSARNIMKYAGTGIPCLVLVNDKGDVVSKSYDGQTNLGPHKVMRDLKKVLEEGGATTVASGSATPVAAPAQAHPGPSVVSPSKTNWDEIFKKKP